MRGGFTVHVTMVRENRAYLSSHKVNVPWTNKNLTVKWESFRDKLQPGQPEKWKATISGPDAKKAVAEMALYSTTKASTNSKLTNGNKLLECSARTTTA